MALRVFIELNGWSWSNYPSVEEAERAVLAAASGEWDEAAVASWRNGRIEGPPSSVG